MIMNIYVFNNLTIELSQKLEKLKYILIDLAFHEWIAIFMPFVHTRTCYSSY